MLQALNILENADLEGMGYNSPKYIHTLYQTMNLAYADRDFYYGDPYFPPDEPVKGLLSKDYAKARYGQINWERNDSTVKPGDPYPYQGGTNPFASLLARWTARYLPPDVDERRWASPTRPSVAQFSRRHHLDRSRGRGGLGRLGDAERRLDPGGDRGSHRSGAEPAGAELRDQGGGRALQRDRAGQAPAGHPHADAGDEGWQTLPLLRGAGWRYPGPEPAPVVPRHRRVRDDAAAGRGGTEHQQLPDAIVVRRARIAARRTARRLVHARQCPHGAHSNGVHARIRGADLRADQRHLLFDQAHGTMWGASSNHGEDYGIAW